MLGLTAISKPSDVYRCTNRPTPRVLKPTYQSGSNREDFDKGELRRELLISVKSVQILSSAVKEDIQKIHKMCPVTSIRAAKFMKKWGAEQLRHTMQKIQRHKVYKAYVQWMAVIKFLNKVEKRQKYQKNKATRRLDLFLSDWARHGLAHGWEIWWKYGLAQKEKEVTRTFPYILVLKCCCLCM